MKRLHLRRPSPAMIIALIALVVATSGVAVAAIPGPDGQIKGCYDTQGLLGIGKGQLRVIDHDKSCRANETAIAWNQQGVKGEKGDKGDPGPVGAQGPEGPSTGDAGGDLTGSYPNPTIATGAVTNEKVASDSLRLGRLASEGGLRSVDPPTIPARSCDSVFVEGLPGTLAMSHVFMGTAGYGLDARLSYTPMGTATGSNDIVVRVCNLSDGAFNPDPVNFDFLVFA